MEKKSSFECNGCGYCCTDESTQINITLLDIKFLSDTTKMSVKELFSKEIVTFIPFIRTEDFSIFDVELGMKRPCPLYKNNKCEAYEGRPMNCRIFPYWFITNKIEETIDCVKDVEPDAVTFFKYRMYERIVGEIILKESEKTDEFMKNIGATQTIDFTGEPDLKKLMKIYKVRTTENDRKSVKITKKLMSLADKKVDLQKLNEKVDLIEKEINSRNFEKEIEILISAESLLDGMITNVNVTYDDKDFKTLK